MRGNPALARLFAYGSEQDLVNVSVDALGAQAGEKRVIEPTLWRWRTPAASGHNGWCHYAAIRGERREQQAEADQLRHGAVGVVGSRSARSDLQCMGIDETTSIGR